MAARELTIVSWNMWCLNKQPNDVIDFIQSLDFDILCLQEVPASILERIRVLPYNSAIAQDCMWDTTIDGKQMTTGDHLVILSKHPIERVRTISLPPLAQSWRVWVTRKLIELMMPARTEEVRNRELLSAYIHIDDQHVQVFSCHLPLLTPATRRTEFMIATAHRDENVPTIICGDFNILDHWTMKPLNWMQGGHLHEMLPWYNERERMDKLFADAGLTNPLAGLVTQKISQSQLDHILVPKSAQILERNVINETHGSDHNPVRLRMAI